MSAIEPRLEVLLARVRSAFAGFKCYKNIRGLLLDLDTLRDLGARPEFLHAWEHGRSFDPSDQIPREFRNHPSVGANEEWAEREWDRLASLRKVSFCSSWSAQACWPQCQPLRFDPEAKGRRCG